MKIIIAEEYGYEGLELYYIVACYLDNEQAKIHYEKIIEEQKTILEYYQRRSEIVEDIIHQNNKYDPKGKSDTYYEILDTELFLHFDQYQESIGL